MRRVVESPNFVSFVLSAAIGLYLFRSWPFPAANNVFRMALPEAVPLFYAGKYAFTTSGWYETAHEIWSGGAWHGVSWLLPFVLVSWPVTYLCEPAAHQRGGNCLNGHAIPA